jgi:hypothetical protein
MMKKLNDFEKYVVLGVLACITVLAIGYLTSEVKVLQPGMLTSVMIILVVLLLVWIFLILRLIFRRTRKIKAELDFSPGDFTDIKKLQDRAMAYCDENINYYQGTRYSSRRYYVNFQLATAILTGITPVLFLIEKSSLVSNYPNLKGTLPWLIIIVPAIASILATTTTVFNFQEDWVQSKRTAESLEALREEYLIGASDLFRLDLPNREKNELARRALENFILKVNEIHLQQVDRWASLHSRVQSAQTVPPFNQDVVEDSKNGAQAPFDVNSRDPDKQNNGSEEVENNQEFTNPQVTEHSPSTSANRVGSKELIPTPPAAGQDEDESDAQAESLSEQKIM